MHGRAGVRADFLVLLFQGFGSGTTVMYCLGVHDVSGTPTGDHLTAAAVGYTVYDMTEV